MHRQCRRLAAGLSVLVLRPTDRQSADGRLPQADPSSSRGCSTAWRDARFDCRERAVSAPAAAGFLDWYRTRLALNLWSGRSIAIAGEHPRPMPSDWRLIAPRYLRL